MIGTLLARAGRAGCIGIFHRVTFGMLVSISIRERDRCAEVKV